MTCAEWERIVQLAREGYAAEDEAVRWEHQGNRAAALHARARASTAAFRLVEQLAKGPEFGRLLEDLFLALAPQIEDAIAEVVDDARREAAQRAAGPVAR